MTIYYYAAVNNNFEKAKFFSKLYKKLQSNPKETMTKVLYVLRKELLWHF